MAEKGRIHLTCHVEKEKGRKRKHDSKVRTSKNQQISNKRKRRKEKKKEKGRWFIEKQGSSPALKTWQRGDKEQKTSGIGKIVEKKTQKQVGERT